MNQKSCPEVVDFLPFVSQTRPPTAPARGLQTVVEKGLRIDHRSASGIVDLGTVRFAGELGPQEPWDRPTAVYVEEAGEIKLW